MARLRCSILTLVLLLGCHGVVLSQCSSSLELRGRKYLHCFGTIYSECTVDLEVNQSGLWVNGKLQAPFEAPVDKLSKDNKALFRQTNVYREAALSGAPDRVALEAALCAKRFATQKLAELSRDIDSRECLDKAKQEIFSDVLISDFVDQLVWSSDLQSLGYKCKGSEAWVFLGTNSVVPSNHQQTDLCRSEESLLRQQEACCKTVEAAVRFCGKDTGQAFVAFILRPSGPGTVGRGTEAELLADLENQ